MAIVRYRQPGAEASGGTRVIDKSRFFTGLFSLPSLFLSLPGKKVKNFFACPLEEAVDDPIL